MPRRRAGNQQYLFAAETQFRKQTPGVLAPIDRFLGQIRRVHSIRESQPLQGGRLTACGYYPDPRSPTRHGPRCGPTTGGHQHRITRRDLQGPRNQDRLWVDHDITHLPLEWRGRTWAVSLGERGYLREHRYRIMR